MKDTGNFPVSSEGGDISVEIIWTGSKSIEVWSASICDALDVGLRMMTLFTHLVMEPELHHVSSIFIFEFHSSSILLFMQQRALASVYLRKLKKYAILRSHTLALSFKMAFADHVTCLR
jgi:hypothetical protein